MNTRIAGLLMAALVTASCGGTSSEPAAASAPAAQDDRPDWVKTGSFLARGEDGSVTAFGVSEVEKMANAAIARNKGDSDARAELAKMLKNDLVLICAQKGDATFVKINAETNVTFSSTIADRYQDPTTGAWYTLAELDLREARASFDPDPAAGQIVIEGLTPEQTKTLLDELINPTPPGGAPAGDEPAGDEPAGDAPAGETP